MANTGIYEEDYDDIDSLLEVDTDTDSNFDETESPADGYFTERPHPSEVFVENSSVTAEADAKAREAAEQRASSSAQAPPSQTQPTTSIAQAPRWSDADTPQLNTEAPPPDYEAATQASSSNFRSPASPRQPAYGSFSSHQHEIVSSEHVDAPASRFRDAPATQWLSHGPINGQSMSDTSRQAPQADEETGLLAHYSTKQKRKRRCGFGKGCGRRMSCCNIFMIIAVIVLIILLSGGFDSMTSDDDDGDWIPGHPAHGDHGHLPKTPAIPAIPSIPSSSPYCHYDSYSDTMAFDFPSPENFSFREFIDNHDHYEAEIGGNVVIRPAMEDQDVDVRLYLKYATTKRWKFLSSNHVQTKDSLVLKSPHLLDQPPISTRACIYVFAYIDVRPGVSLTAWDITTTHMNIKVQDGLFAPQIEGEDTDKGRSGLEISESSTFTTVLGNLNASYWSSRETEVEVISGSIRGTFALRDLLSLKTQSGSIQVSVDPQRVDKARPLPASSIFHSTSGHVSAHFPLTGYIPERDYRTRVEVISSSIAGTYILGSHTSFHAQSGSIKADLLPFFDRAVDAALRTDSGSGHTGLTILPPYDAPNDNEPWANTSFSHKTTTISGSVDIGYPQVWEGNISATAISGSIRVRGRDVRIVNDKSRGPMRTVDAIKGKGRNRLDVRATSASIRIRVGEGY